MTTMTAVVLKATPCTNSLWGDDNVYLGGSEKDANFDRFCTVDLNLYGDIWHRDRAAVKTSQFSGLNRTTPDVWDYLD